MRAPDSTQHFSDRVADVGAGHPRHQAMQDALQPLFDRCQCAGSIGLDYDTRVFAGELP